MTYCAITVATAAPLTPNLNANMRMGSKTMLTKFPHTASATKNNSKGQ